MTYTNNLIPVMTANNAPAPYVASAITEYELYFAYKAFDQDNTGENYYMSHPDKTATLKLDFGKNVKIAQYSIYPFSAIPTRYNPKNWTFQGSLNDSSWTTLDTQTNISWVASTKQYFAITNPGLYRYYEIVVSASVDGSAVIIMGMEMFGLFNTGFSGVSNPWIF